MRGLAAAAALVVVVGCGEQPADTLEDASVAQPERDPGGALPGDDVAAQSPLTRIARAERETVFTGWKTATSGPEGGRQTRMKVSRLADGRTYMAWDQQGRTDMRWVYRSRHAWIDDPSLLAANYDVVEVEDEEATVAWRDARTFDVRSRRTGRPSMTLVIDSERWLALGEVIRDYEGEQSFEWHFDTIEFDPSEVPEELPEGAGRPVEDASRRTAESGEESAVPPGRLHAAALPDGFVHVERRAFGEDGTADYYSDGLAAIRIHQRPAPLASESSEGELSRSSCSGRSGVSGIFSGTEVSIVGNLPLAELEALAASLRVRP